LYFRQLEQCMKARGWSRKWYCHWPIQVMHCLSCFPQWDFEFKATLWLCNAVLSILVRGVSFSDNVITQFPCNSNVDTPHFTWLPVYILCMESLEWLQLKMEELKEAATWQHTDQESHYCIHRTFAGQATSWWRGRRPIHRDRL
jgi:hypothetical protein